MTRPTQEQIRRASVWLKDGAVVLIADTDGAMLTVRGKDHDLTPAECRELAAALLAAADLHEGEA